MKTLRLISAGLLAVFLSLTFTSCSDDEEEKETVSKIEIDGGATLNVFIGENNKIKVKHYPSHLSAPKYSWTSIDPSVVEIDSHTGDYVAKSIGKSVVTVTAVDLNLSAQCEITVNPIEITDITISSSEKELVIGQEYTLTATIVPENATYKDVKWFSSNSNIASVDDNGKIVAVAEGECNIGASTKNGKADVCKVTVKPVEITEIKISASEKELIVGEEFVLTATIVPENATYKDVEWISSDTKIATVSNTGVVKTIKEGECDISAKAKNGKTAVCKIIVKAIDVEGITLNVTEKVIEVGETFTIVATITPEDATYKDLAWSSSNTNIAAVDTDGKVTAVKEGECLIYAETSNGKRAECKVVVKPVSVKNVVFSESKVKLLVGDTKELKYVINPSNAKIVDLKWSVEDESIASVSEDGVVTCKGLGKTQVTLTVNEEYVATCQIEGCSIEEFISLVFKGYIVSGGYLLSDGWMKGIEVECYLRNLSSQSVVVKCIDLIDSVRDLQVHFDTGNEEVSPNTYLGYKIPITYEMYKPIFRWTYIYDGKEYTVDKVFVGNTGGFGANVRMNGTLKTVAPNK